MQPIINCRSIIVGGLLLSLATPLTASTSETELAPAIQFTELSRKVVQKDGHTLTLIRVRPPVLPPPPQIEPTREPTPEELADMLEAEQKRYVSLGVSVTVYLRDGKPPISELRWRDADGNLTYKAWSNVDFRYMTQLHHLETDEVVYSWFPFVDAWNLAELPDDHPNPIPADVTFPAAGPAEYLLDSRTVESETEKDVLAGLDYLHAYYQLNFPRLKEIHEKLWAENAAREKELRDNPPVRPDTDIHFWPVKSGKTIRR